MHKIVRSQEACKLLATLLDTPSWGDEIMQCLQDVLDMGVDSFSQHVCTKDSSPDIRLASAAFAVLGAEPHLIHPGSQVVLAQRPRNLATVVAGDSWRSGEVTVLMHSTLSCCTDKPYRLIPVSDDKQVCIHT